MSEERIRGTLTLCFPRRGPTPQLSGTVFVISHGILWYGCITIAGHISLEADKVNVSVVDISAVPLKNFYLFCMFKVFIFGCNWKPYASPLKILVGF
jgi:hypothetical protein